MTVRKSQNPAYPDAHPTAPGGMSMAALRKELVARHGYDEDSLADIKWPDLIQMVIDGRLAREAEEKAGLRNDTDIMADDFESPTLDVAEMFPSDDEDDLDDFADLLDEYEGEVPEVTNEMVQSVLDGADTDEIIDPEVYFEEMMAERDAALADAPPPLFLGIPGTRDYVFDGHAGAGPSASERWMNCTMSLTASRDFLKSLSPNQQRQFAGANTAARQGTTAHSVGEAQANLMLGHIEQDEYDATILTLTLEPEEEAEAYTDEMAEYVTEYTDLIMTYAQERGVDHILIESTVEAAIPLAGAHEGEAYVVRGKGDCVVLPTEEDPDLVVIDLKYGDGIWVDVEENSQEMIYALGALDLLADEDGNLITEVKTVTLYIAQPRLGGLRKWTVTLDELFDWRDDVLSPRLTEALYGDFATFTPGKTQCQFCPARGGCPALAEQRISEGAALFDAIVEAESVGHDTSEGFPETTALSNERLGELLTQSSNLVKINADLKEEAQRRLHRGLQVPGFLLVNYTPRRSWKEGAIDKIPATRRKVLLAEPKLITPAAAEKILKDDYAKIEKLIDKPDKRPVIAPVGDRRTPWGGPPPEQMFPDLPDDEDGA